MIPLSIGVPFHNVSVRTDAVCKPGNRWALPF